MPKDLESVINVIRCEPIRLAYFHFIHFTLTYSTGQDHTHFDCEYLANGYKLGKRYSCQQMRIATRYFA